ncbi:proline dehydrogenase [Candidatus Protofrankia californiensis]|uniref:proline dehydrogenase n=1 Tax=Candidatus Protofrankia californiensis TaxID=1839754 RepID=A0A1C3PFW7_9ACTN|nr:proline dehydrogenase [Candidatus Protofrankia californiensis]
MLRTALLMASGDPRVRRLVSTAPLTRGVVARFVAGEDVTAAVTVAAGLRDAGLRVSLDLLGEDVTDCHLAEESAADYSELLRALADAGLTPETEVSVKLSALGAGLDASLARDLAFRVCQAARDAGTCVTVDMEDHTTTDATLTVVAELRREFDETGAVVQAYLRRTEADCRDLAVAGGRVRLCKGAYAEPASVAYIRRAEVNASYARCLAVLMAGRGYPMVATHDPALVELAASLAGELAVGGRLAGRAVGPLQGSDRRPFEYQMLYGVRPGEQRRLARAGEVVRVYVPCGREWYGYLMRRLAERPANLLFFVRALRSTA